MSQKKQPVFNLAKRLVLGLAIISAATAVQMTYKLLKALRRITRLIAVMSTHHSATLLLKDSTVTRHFTHR